MKHNGKPILATLGLTLVVVAASHADHPDRKHRPSGKAEYSLSGVYIDAHGHDSIRNEDGVYVEAMRGVLRYLGKPVTIAAKNRCESNFLWLAGPVRMEVGSGCVFQKVAGKDVMRTHGAYAVEVWGIRPHGRIGVTGRGLALGDSWAKVKRLYGTRCECGRYTTGTGVQNTHGLKYARYAQYQWGDRVELAVDADAHGRVVHILLAGDLE